MIDDALAKKTARRGAGAPVRGPDGVGQRADRGRRRPDRQPGRRREGRRHAPRRPPRSSASWASRRRRRQGCPPTPRTRRARASSRAAPTTRSTTRSSTRAPRQSARTSRRTWAGRATRAREKDKPSRPPLGGINIGVSKYSRDARSGLRGGRVPRQREAPRRRRRAGRPAADDRVGLQHRAGQEGVPVRRPAARVDRGRRAAARDARLQRHLAGDPEDLQPA